MPGGSPGFDPFLQGGFPQSQPYYGAPPQPAFQAYPQPRPAPRPAVQQSRPQPRPAPVARPRIDPVAAVKTIHVPAPELLGIHLDELTPVAVPEPDRLGIRLD